MGKDNGNNSKIVHGGSEILTYECKIKVTVLRTLLDMGVIQYPDVSSRYKNSIMSALIGELTDLRIDLQAFQPYLDRLLTLKDDQEILNKWKAKSIEHLVRTYRILEWYFNCCSLAFKGG